jgi:hypothetical protein
VQFLCPEVGVREGGGEGGGGGGGGQTVQRREAKKTMMMEVGDVVSNKYERGRLTPNKKDPM